MIHRHYCPNCSARMEFAGAHCGREDCKSAAYVIALKASGAASVMSYEDGRDPHAGPRLAEIERLSTVDSKKVLDFLLAGPGVRLFPSVDQPQTQALPKSECNSQKYPPCVGHYGPPEFREWNFIGRDVPPDLERKLPAGDPNKLVRVFFRYAPNGWIAETFGGFTKSEVFQSANEAMLWANQTFCPTAEVKKETRWGVWLTPKPEFAYLSRSQWLGQAGRDRGALSLDDARRFLREYEQREDRRFTAQIREYLNKHSPGNLWTEPPESPDVFSYPEAAVAPALYGAELFHLMRAYELKWEDPSKPEKISDWRKTNVHNVQGVGEVCDYIRDVPERSLSLKVRLDENAGSLGWIPEIEYFQRARQWLGHGFKTAAEAMAFCDQKAKER